MPAAFSSRNARPHALATASGSGLSCVRMSARSCARATASSLRSRSRRANCAVWSGGRTSMCDVGAWPMEWGRTLVAPAGGGNLPLPPPPQARPISLRRNLQVAGDFGESLVVDQPAEGQGADLSLADLLVAVDAAAARLHRVVQVKGARLFDAQQLVEAGESLVVAPVAGDVVSGGEDVAGVEADGDALGALAALDDPGEPLQ